MAERRLRQALLDLLASPALWVGLLFLLLLTGMRALSPLFATAFPGVEPPVYDRSSFVTLWLSHAGLVAVSSLSATVIGVGAAILVTRPVGRAFRPLAATLATIGQTFPPAAVLALAVPAIGFGPRPTIVALFLYGLLPIVENAIVGLEGVPAAIREAADGMGLTALQRLWRVDLPLAAPAILAGVRVSVTIGIGTATIGSTVGALTLGTPIFDGLVANKVPFILQGAVLIALFAIWTDLLFARAERWFARPGVA